MRASSLFLRASLFLAVVGTGSTVAGCTSREPAVATFEDFYGATVGRDLATVRSLLCPMERRALQAVPDDELLQAFAVVKVLRSVRLAEQSDAAAVVDAEDALGAHTKIRLRSDLNAPRGWCVAGPVDDGAAR